MMMREDVALILVGLATLSISGVVATAPLGLEDEGRPPVTVENGEDLQARTFVNRAAVGSREWARLGWLAVREARLRAFGRRVGGAQQISQPELEALATCYDAKDLLESSEERGRVVKSLEHLEEDALDAALIRRVTVEHQRAVDLFERGRRVEDENVRRFPMETPPLLRDPGELAAQ